MQRRWYSAEQLPTPSELFHFVEGDFYELENQSPRVRYVILQCLTESTLHLSHQAQAGRHVNAFTRHLMYAMESGCHIKLNQAAESDLQLINVVYDCTFCIATTKPQRGGISIAIDMIPDPKPPSPVGVTCQCSTRHLMNAMDQDEILN